MSEKKDFGSAVRKVLKIFTVSQARILSIALTILILLLFLATSAGRSIIEFLGYIGFVAGVLFGGYKLYLYTTENAKDASDKKRGTEPIEEELDFVPFDDAPSGAKSEVTTSDEGTDEDNNQADD